MTLRARTAGVFMVKQREVRNRAVFACLGCNLPAYRRTRAASGDRDFATILPEPGPAEAAAETAADAVGTG
jgi:hypothetical protein